MHILESARAQLRERPVVFISLSQFGAHFNLHFVNVFLPFFLMSISPYPREQTLLWIGMLMSAPGVLTAIMSPIWGAMTHRFSPKLLYIRGLTVHAIGFGLIGFTTHLPMVFLLRAVQGTAGGVSTIAMIMVSSVSAKGRIAPNMGFLQSFMTLGQLVGPPLGTFAAATFGYTGAFLAASAVSLGSVGVCWGLVPKLEPIARAEKSRGRAAVTRRVLAGWGLCFISHLQLMFLPPILPTVLQGFHMTQAEALRLAGVIVMLYTASSMVGTYLFSSLARSLAIERLLALIVGLSVIFSLSLSFAGGVVSFTLIRMAQTGLCTAIVPLVVSIFAGEQRGSVIGFLNSSRFVGISAGPLVATSLVAYASLPVLYGVISGITVVALAAFLLLFGGEERGKAAPARQTA